MKLTTLLILIVSKICLSPRREVINFSNLFNNKVKMEIRSNYSYKRDYWMEIKY